MGWCLLVLMFFCAGGFCECIFLMLVFFQPMLLFFCLLFLGSRVFSILVFVWSRVFFYASVCNCEVVSLAKYR